MFGGREQRRGVCEHGHRDVAMWAVGKAIPYRGPIGCYGLSRARARLWSRAHESSVHTYEPYAPEARRVPVGAVGRARGWLRRRLGYVTLGAGGAAAAPCAVLVRSPDSTPRAETRPCGCGRAGPAAVRAVYKSRAVAADSRGARVAPRRVPRSGLRGGGPRGRVGSRRIDRVKQHEIIMVSYTPAGWAAVVIYTDLTCWRSRGVLHARYTRTRPGVSDVGAGSEGPSLHWHCAARFDAPPHPCAAEVPAA